MNENIQKLGLDFCNFSCIHVWKCFMLKNADEKLEKNQETPLLLSLLSTAPAIYWSKDQKAVES